MCVCVSVCCASLCDNSSLTTVKSSESDQSESRFPVPVLNTERCFHVHELTPDEDPE